MKFGVVIFPGSNCDMDMIYVLESIMKKKVVRLWHKDTDLQEADFIILPGGFSFGDYLRSGAIASFSSVSMMRYCLFRIVILPRPRSYGESSTATLSPTSS